MLCRGLRKFSKASCLSVSRNTVKEPRYIYWRNEEGGEIEDVLIPLPDSSIRGVYVGSRNVEGGSRHEWEIHCASPLGIAMSQVVAMCEVMQVCFHPHPSKTWGSALTFGASALGSPDHPRGHYMYLLNMRQAEETVEGYTVWSEVFVM